MNEELKARLREHDDERLYLEADELLSQAAYAIEQLERQLAERDAELKKYRDTPVVAWTNEKGDITQDYDRLNSWVNTLGYTPLQLIVKPGERR